MTISDGAAVDLLQAMIAAASPCGEEDGVAAVILDAIRSAGFEAHRDDAGNVVGTIGTGDRTVMFLGHMDTAPGIVPVRECDGRLYGRGSVDAKGPLATGIVAAARAAGRSRARLVVVGAVQEEGPSVGARHLGQGEAPDLLIIGEPSNWDAMTLGYKGSQRFEIQFKCPSAHTGSPEPTTPELAFAFWERLVKWCASVAPNATREFDRLTPKLIAMSSDSDGLSAIASLHVGLRLPPDISLESVREGVGDLVKQFLNSHGGGLVGAGSCRARPAPPNDDAANSDNVCTTDKIGDTPCGVFGVDIDFAPGEPAVRVERRGPLVSAFLRAIRAEGGEPRFKVKTGTSDWNVVASRWQCPTVAYGPGDSTLDHTPDEHIEIDEYLRGIRVLMRVLEEV